MVKGDRHQTVGNTMSTVSKRNGVGVMETVGDTFCNEHSST